MSHGSSDSEALQPDAAALLGIEDRALGLEPIEIVQLLHRREPERGVLPEHPMQPRRACALGSDDQKIWTLSSYRRHARSFPSRFWVATIRLGSLFTAA